MGLWGEEGGSSLRESSSPASSSLLFSAFPVGNRYWKNYILWGKQFAGDDPTLVKEDDGVFFPAHNNLQVRKLSVCRNHLFLGLRSIKK